METNSVLICCTSILVLICSFLIFHTFLVNNVKEQKKPSIDLAVCILSARNNTDLRNAIRKTWLKTENPPKSDEKSVVARFVVGFASCDIHPDNRISTHSCKRWKFSLPANPSQDIFMFSTFDESWQAKTKRSVVSSVIIETMHPIILKRVGLVEFFPFDKIPKSAHIVLYDEATEEEIGRARFTNSFKGNLLHGYNYKPVEELRLPKVGLSAQWMMDEVKHLKSSHLLG